MYGRKYHRYVIRRRRRKDLLDHPTAMSDTHARVDTRTLYEATLDVRFGQHYNDLNARFYRRLDLVFGFAGLFGGSGALIAALGEYKTLGIITGAIVAAIAVIERLVRPVEKAVLHDEFKSHFANLDILADDLDLIGLDRALKKLQNDGPTGFHVLKIPAYNCNLRANGRPDYIQPLTRWERFITALA